jgi:signal transduction histidine kinase
MKKEKNLKANFFLIFAGTGLLISFGVCALMYLQFRSHVKHSYYDTLSRVTVMIEKKYPVLHDIEKMRQGPEEDEEWFWGTSREFGDIAESFGLAYIYFIERREGEYVFRMSSAISKNYHPEWLNGPVWENGSPPPEVDAAYNSKRLTLSPRPWVDEWGVLVSAYLPVVTNGKTVGLLGADYEISYVNALYRRLSVFLIIAFSASAALTGLLAFFASRQVLVSVEERERAVREAEERRMEIENLMKALKTVSASRSAVLASISNEMSNPINVIINLSSAMMEDKEIIEKQGKNLELITDSGVTLLNVINDILDISKLEAGQMKITPTEYKVADLISDISGYHRIIIENKPILFMLNIDKKLPLKLYGDWFRIKHICYHLLDNAYKYTVEGTITLDISCKHEDRFVWLFIKVTDTGKGIKEEDLGSLSVGYGQSDIVAKYRAGGTGLGLNIASRVAKLMKGKVLAASEYGKGSTFSLCVPQKLLSKETIRPEVIEKLKSFRYSGQNKSL